ncbi:MAG: hypothetical protein E7670_05375 [Ruminococcaceae bacterium]|nr:hypothetical protein [Oscillospiraceae bacterium]
MSVFLPTLTQMAFLFAFIVLGYILSKLKVVPDNSAGVLAKLENNLFIPALVMGTFINNFTINKLSSAGKLFALSFIVMVITIPLSILVSHLCAKDTYTKNIYTYGMSFSNFGFMGNAIVSALFPDVFLEYLIFTLPLWIMIYLWGVPSLLISDGSKKSVKEKLKNFLNPMFICMIIGMVIGLISAPLNLALPSWIISADGSGGVIGVAGSCMSPIAMILTGMTVAKIDLKKAFTNLGVYAICFFRLIAFPLLFIGIFALIPPLFAANEWYAFVVCTVCSVAMPLGLNTIVIPSAYGKDTTVASGMALVSHLLSCLSIPVIFMILNLVL